MRFKVTQEVSVLVFQSEDKDGGVAIVVSECKKDAVYLLKSLSGKNILIKELGEKDLRKIKIPGYSRRKITNAYDLLKTEMKYFRGDSFYLYVSHNF